MKSLKIVVPAFLLIVTFFSCVSSDESDASNETINQPPNSFELTTVANNATDVDLLPTLNWQTAVDPDGDTVTYEIYLDTNTEPVTTLATGLTITSFTLSESLSFNTTYYWKVVAMDDKEGRTASKGAYNFTTLSENQAPNSFGLISVENSTTGVDVLPVFSWEAAEDPEGGMVTFSIYLDTTDNPSVEIATGLTSTNFTLEDRLNYITAYNWKVVAVDSKGLQTTSNDVYNFTTRGMSVVANSSAFSIKADHSTEVFDGKMWVLGGRGLSVIFSSDGVTWTEVNTNTVFPSRRLHSSVVFQGKMWVIGGAVGGLHSNDVWTSSDGINWTEVVVNQPFSLRYGQKSVVYNNKIWVVGGNYGVSGLNDVWSSTDGVTWTEETASASFPGRGGHSFVVFNDKMWIIGGWENESSHLNDVWSSVDGVTWVEETSNAEFSKRQRHTTVVYEDKMWVIGGVAPDIESKNDLWSSVDGVTWTEVASNGGFYPRYGHSSVTFNDKIWILGGQADNTSYYKEALYLD